MSSTCRALALVTSIAALAACSSDGDSTGAPTSPGGAPSDPGNDGGDGNGTTAGGGTIPGGGPTLDGGATTPHPESGPKAGNPDGKAIVPAEAQPEDVSSPKTVVGAGAPASCTGEAFVAA